MSGLKQSKFVRMTAVLVAVLILGVAIYYFVQLTPNPKEYRIGAILPLTGVLAEMGHYERDGMILAQEEINKQQILPERLDIAFDDSKGDPTVGATIANKYLTIDNIKVILTSTTGVSLAVRPVVDRAGALLVAFCQDPTISLSSASVFRLYYGVEQEASTMLSYFRANLSSLKKVGVLYVQAPQFQKIIDDTFIPFFKKNKVDFSVRETFTNSQVDFRDLVTKLKAENIDHLIVLGYGFNYPNLLRELDQQGVLNRIRIIGGWGFLYVKADPKLLNGIIVAAPSYVYEHNTAIQSFYDSYNKRFGEPPNFDAAFAYNAIMVLGKALQRASSFTPSGIETALASISKYQSVLGNVTISKSRELDVSMGLGIYRNGNIQPYGN